MDFRSSEQCFQFGRSIGQQKMSLAKEMMDAPHAGRVKALSHHLDPSTIDRSCDVRLMLGILLAKAEQDSKFRNCLRSTGTQPLIHSTHPRDTFWATGLSANLRSFERGKGANVFGLLLEIVRATLRPEAKYPKEPTPPPNGNAPAPAPALPILRRPPFPQRTSPVRQPIPPCRPPPPLRRPHQCRSSPRHMRVAVLPCCPVPFLETRQYRSSMAKDLPLHCLTLPLLLPSVPPCRTLLT
jgi:predicted NAD-dependent protein-ADP-ribosyltransferase YbiA (DUF1768 family)